mmetsp:Transcript_22607/g.47311  ORF Transcript_22607/g.47311 Transcript_22607/m.47311 type:complete len:200 (+) Transcript_22607:337-936(+)
MATWKGKLVFASTRRPVGWRTKMVGSACSLCAASRLAKTSCNSVSLVSTGRSTSEGSFSSSSLPSFISTAACDGAVCAIRASLGSAPAPASCSAWEASPAVLAASSLRPSTCNAFARSDSAAAERSWRDDNFARCAASSAIRRVVSQAVCVGSLTPFSSCKASARRASNAARASPAASASCLNNLCALVADVRAALLLP